MDAFPPVPEFYGAQVGKQVAMPPELLQAMQAWKAQAIPPTPQPANPLMLALQDWLDRTRGLMTRMGSTPRR